MKNSPDPNKIHSMFSQVAKRYDIANTILSLGIHHLWRTQLVRLSQVARGSSVLDCATGTGDLAIEFKKAVGPEGQVIGTDFNAEMISSAPAKAKVKNLDIKFEIADAMDLKYPDSSFDVVSISFGIRNVGDPLKALNEMARVLKPGGRLMVLEFGEMEDSVFSNLYQIYSKKILPKIGGLVSGQPSAYEYLQNSSAAFPSRENFLNLMRSTGKLHDVNFKSFSLGICYAYWGIKN